MPDKQNLSGEAEHLKFGRNIRCHYRTSMAHWQHMFRNRQCNPLSLWSVRFLCI